MIITAADIMKALLEMSRTLPDGEVFLRDVRDGLSRHLGQEEQAIRVTLVTPDGNAGELKEKVLQMLKAKYDRPVEFTEEADPAIIGGAVVRFNDEQIDLSVRGALRQAAGSFADSGAPSKKS